MTIETSLTLKKNDIVRLTVARPMRTIAGNVFVDGDLFKYIGRHGSCLKLKRIVDQAPLMTLAESISFR
jgi:hypothetical protein